MQDQRGFFDADERLQRLSDLGDQLEAFEAVVDFEIFRPELTTALAYSDGSQGGRPPFDPVMMFKILVIQAANNLSDERTEFLINDRLSFMRFLGLSLSDRVPDARTIWLFREKLTKAGAISRLFERFDAMLRVAGFIAMSGQIVDASLIAAPRQRNTEDEKKAIKEGRIPDDWKKKPAKLRQKDRDARWTLKSTKAKPKEDSAPQVDLAIPVFGYQNHVSIDRGFGFIRKWSATDAAAYEGRRLREGLLDKTNTASGVWADTAYRSATNEEFMERNGFVSHVHRKKPKGRAMPEAMRRANAAKSKIRSRVEHVFAEQKDRMGLFVHRHRQGDNKGWTGKPGLQHQAPALPAPPCRDLTDSCVPAAQTPARGPRQTKKSGPKPSQTAQLRNFAALIEVSSSVLHSIIVAM
jgi:transposase, IS5 family